MKKSFITTFGAMVLACVFMLLLSCESKNENIYLSKLQAIKMLGDTVPDVALTELAKFNKNNIAPTQYASMKEKLLGIRLRDKSYVMPSTDDSIKHVYNFFKSQGTTNDKAESCYYMASVYRDLNDGPRAITYFLEAIKHLEQCNKPDTMLMINSYSQLCDLYCKLFLYKDAVKIALKEFGLAEKSGHLNPTIIMDVCTPYIQMGYTRLACKYAILAEKEIVRTSSVDKYTDVIAELLFVYTSKNKKSDADRCYKLLKTTKTPQLPVNYYLAMATYHNKYVSSESALPYMYEYLDNADTENAKYNASMLLFKYYSLKPDINKTHYYAKLIDKYSEAWKWGLKQEQMISSKNFYKYQIDKEYEQKLKERALRSERNLVCGGVMMTFVIMLIIAIYNYKKKRILLKMLCIKKEADISKDTLIEKSKELERINSKYQHTNNELSKLNKELQQADEELQRRMAQNALLVRIANQSKIENGNSHILAKFRFAANGREIVSSDDWKELFSTVNKMYPNFEAEILQKIIKLTQDIRMICYLLKIGMSNPQIEHITGIPRQTVWRKVKYIRELMGDSLESKF